MICSCLGLVACGKHTSSGAGSRSVAPLPVPQLAIVPDLDPQIAQLIPANYLKTTPAGVTAVTQAPVLSQIQVATGRDSVLVSVPVVAGAADYRVVVLQGAASVTLQGQAEFVANADIYCAGIRQFNAVNPTTPVVMQQIEVFGLQQSTVLMVEAIDTLCPFVGVRGSASFSEVAGTSEVPAADHVAETIDTTAQLQSTYHNNLYINGHRPGSILAAQASESNPTVLARAFITVTPTGNTSPELAYYDDFPPGAPQPQYVTSLPADPNRNANGQRYQTEFWNIFQYEYDKTDLLIDRGQLQVALMDYAQDTFGSNYMLARRPVALDDQNYLHITYTVNSNSTQRRYWWIFLCGAQIAGKTIDAHGELLGTIVNTPFFYQPDGINPSYEAWNCLQVFPRDGSPFGLNPNNQRPQSDIRVMVNLANQPYRQGVVNVSPDQYNDGINTPGWYRQQDAHGNLIAPILDDQMTIAPRARYDMYVRRNRVVLFVNGEQRLCNDFPSVALTMAEGALGFGQVLYHSAAERLEFSSSTDLRTGQQYYLHNTPYIDVRSWDNLGYQEQSQAPSYFDASLCYVYHG